MEKERNWKPKLLFLYSINGGIQERWLEKYLKNLKK